MPSNSPDKSTAWAIKWVGNPCAFDAPEWSRSDHGICAARGAILEPAAGEAWIGVGDAAFAVDPLASTGLFNALYFGLAAAETADRMLGGDPEAAGDYANDLHRVCSAYARNLAFFYCLERRWPDRPFWRRRHVVTSGEKPMPFARGQFETILPRKKTKARP